LSGGFVETKLLFREDRPMMLIASLLLALIPLLGIVWILLYGSITTVDGLFTSLILLAMSGILALNALLELRRRGSASPMPVAASGAYAGGLVEKGKVASVQFYEAAVGQPNKSIVTLSDRSKPSRMLVFEGDVRNALPVGQKVEIEFRKAAGHNVLLQVKYP
jgi:hypothetical protein